MEMKNNKVDSKLKVWLPLVFAIVLSLGMTLGFKLHDSLHNKRDLEGSLQRHDRLEEIIDLIKEKYVDTINTNGMYNDAVTGIVSHLDPHTVYIPADELQSVNEELEGGFSGIGISFVVLRDTVHVASLIPGGPSEAAGLRIGEQIIQVGKKVIAGKKLPTDSIVHLLKGPQHTVVAVAIREPISGKIRQVQITRDVVVVNSIDIAMMLDSITGFIKIDKFSANTGAEFIKALKLLKSKGLRQLIVDLRENPGGFLDAANTIADQFLDDNKLVVYTEGRNSPRKEYKASDRGEFETGKLVILVDESSASASEILSGAIQDWDRGVIVGRRTFGKGLVQEQYELGDGSALRLTIAKYYTPSGRCIQRSFAKGRDAYEKAFEERFHSGELTGKDSIQEDTAKFYTANKRMVHGGGGIKPDVYVPYDTAIFSSSLLSMVFSEELRGIILDYYNHNQAVLKYKDVNEFMLKFNAEQGITNNYIASLSDSAKKLAQKIFSNNASSAFLKLRIKAQIARYIFGDKGYYTVIGKEDEVLQHAMQVFNNGTYSKLIGR